MRRGIFLLAAVAASAFAQRPVDVRGTFGTAAFADDSAQVHGSVGGSARFYVTRRFAIEPEFQYLTLNRNHHDWLFIPNVSFDFRSIDKRVVPYVIGGAGYLRTSDGIVRLFTVDTWLAEGGGGAKIYLTRSFFIAPETRIGSELYLRTTVSLGYTFGR